MKLTESVAAQLRLKPRRNRPFLLHHPWVHAHALETTGDSLPCGSVVDLLDAHGEFLGRGLINPASKLRLRLYSFDVNTELSNEFFADRLALAIARRKRWMTDAEGSSESSTISQPPAFDGGMRWVFSEGDRISGLIVDQYADALNVTWTSAALATRRDVIEPLLSEELSAKHVFSQMDVSTAKREGESPWGLWLEPPADEAIRYRENGLVRTVRMSEGQKTGGYLDQRFNHAAAAKYFANRRVLDVCCYQGGFSLVASAAGAASVTAVDSSRRALEQADADAKANGLPEIDFVQADCFDFLTDLAENEPQFDTIVLDPPKFAGTRQQVDRALRAYRRLNRLALRCLTPGGTMITCSCSGSVDQEDFLGVLAHASRSENVDLSLLEVRGAGPDHPVAVSCPETRYLKCVIAGIDR